MTDTEITALAREYAEEISPVRQLDDHPVSKMIADIMRKALSEVTAEQIKNFEGFIRFLFRRYYLVEKSKITEEYKAAQKDQHSNDSIRFIEGRTVSAALVNIFPEIAKEVEE